MRSKLFFTKFLLAVPFVFSITAPDASATDLVEIYGLAVQNDATLAVARERKLMGMEAVPQGLAALLPSIAASAQSSLIEQQASSPERYRNNGYDLTLRVPLFHWDDIKGYEKAQKEEKRALLEYTASEQEMVMRVAKLYYDTLLAEDSLGFAQAEKESMAKRLESTKLRMEVATAVITDLHDATAAFDLAVSGVINAENQHASRLEALQEVIGQPVKAIAPLKAEIPLIKPTPENMDSWIQTAQTENLNLKLAILGKEIAADAAEAALAGHLPAVDLIAAENFGDSTAGPRWQGGVNRTDSLTVRMSVPLYSGGGATSKVRQARAGHSMAQQAVDLAQRQVVRQTRDAYRGVLSAIAQVKATSQVLTSSQAMLETTEAGYDAGLRTMVDVLAAQKEVFRAKRDHAQARYAYILQSLGLKQVSGLISGQDLEAINAWNRH